MAGSTIGRYGMPMGPRITSVFLVVGFAVASLAACATPGGAADPNPTVTVPTIQHPTAPASTPSATPAAPTPAAIVVTSTSVSVVSTVGATLVDLPYTSDGPTAVAQLAAAIGADPVVSAVEESDCVRPTTSYDWGSFKINSPAQGASHHGALFNIETPRGARTSGLPVELPDGASVGDPAAPLVAEGAHTTWDGLLLVDPQEGDLWGVVVGVGVGDSINGFIAPYYYNPHNGC